MTEVSENANIGFAFGGDGNCNLSTWETAMREFSQIKLVFQDAHLIFGERKLRS